MKVRQFLGKQDFRGVTILLSLIFLLAGFFPASSSSRVVRPLNDGWKFCLSDDSTAIRPDFDDKDWRTLTLPHDWAFENGYSADGAQRANGGYACGGIGWYRRTFSLTEAECRSGRMFLDFDAVYMNSEVWINGHYLGKRPYGYISFGYELTDYVRPGKNVVSVRVDNSREPSARWYHGCGIYGNVALRRVADIHFEQWGTYVGVAGCSSEAVKLSIVSSLNGKMTGKEKVDFRILDKNGREVFVSGKLKSEKMTVRTDVTLRNPELWDLDTPCLYTLEARLWKNGKLADKVCQRFGVRDIRWDGATGFWLNGRNVKIQGVCEHLEGGPVGAAWTENLIRWKVRMLKDMGCNAIRTAHNPQLPMFYDICDEMGMLVLDEAFDGWQKKAAEDYGKQAFSEWWERDLRDFLRRDRNHPSVIAYSLGNETHGAVAAEMVRVCHEEDPFRLVTSGHSASDVMDLFGVNGNSEKQSFIRDYQVTDRAFVGTETPHTWQVRGYYRTHTWYRDGYPNKGQDPFETPNLTEKELFHYEWASPDKWANGKQHFNSSYDNAFVRINARQNMEFLRDLPWYAASFRWTGFDYVGEAGYVHGGWPFRAFMGGVIDLAGFPKDHYYLYQSQWGKEPMVHILPHWTHPDMKKGELLPVWVYTTGDEVELFINGRSLGRKQKGRKWNEMQCEWLVPWEEGTLSAVAYSCGKEIGRAVQQTADAPARLCLTVEDASLTGSDHDLHIVSIAQTDGKGTLYPYGENRVYWKLEGGEVFSAENGDPVDVETNYHAASRKAFFGLLRLFVRKTADSPILYTAAILGDKRLKADNRVSVDVRAIRLDGTDVEADYRVYYTTDGSDPAISGRLYEGPFAMTDGTVRAIVKLSDGSVLAMEEKFGKGEGIYWGNAGEEAELYAVQAEDCQLSGCRTADAGAGFQGRGYALLSSGQGLTFYQENDGSTHKSSLKYRYFVEREGTAILELTVDGKVEATLRLTASETETGKWKEGTAVVGLRSGANVIGLKALSGPDVGIDCFDFTNDAAQ